jgi:DNA-binding transcriptional regulator YdaS (Cro superfamily)
MAIQTHAGHPTTYVVDSTTIIVVIILTRKQRLLYSGDMDASPEKTALATAAALCGGQAALARLLSRALSKPVSQQRIWNALHRDRSIPAQWCLAIESATAGQVTRRDLRPDLYP